MIKVVLKALALLPFVTPVIAVLWMIHDHRRVASRRDSYLMEERRHRATAEIGGNMK